MSKREYQREWIAARRAAWFTGKTCQSCGTTERLEIHHRDPAQKVHHAVWSWTLARRGEELAKCDVLCRACHEQAHHGHRPSEREGAHAWLAEWDRRQAAKRDRRREKRFERESA